MKTFIMFADLLSDFRIQFVFLLCRGEFVSKLVLVSSV